MVDEKGLLPRLASIFLTYTRDKDKEPKDSPITYTKPMCMLLADLSVLCSFKRVLREVLMPTKVVDAFSSLPARKSDEAAWVMSWQEGRRESL